MPKESIQQAAESIENEKRALNSDLVVEKTASSCQPSVKQTHNRLLVFRMGCVASPFVTLFQKWWIVLSDSSQGCGPGTQMLALNGRRNVVITVAERNWGWFHSLNFCSLATLLNWTWPWEVPAFCHLDVIKMYRRCQHESTVWAVRQWNVRRYPSITAEPAEMCYYGMPCLQLED